MYYENVLIEFANRTKINLDTIRQLREQGHEVYEVTQLINSMVGLLIFPKERHWDLIPETPLAELEAAGWPVPRVSQEFEQAPNLRRLIKYLRNAIAHFNIDLQPDPSTGHIKGLVVSNVDPRRRTVTWKAEMTVDELGAIAERLLAVLQERLTYPEYSTSHQP